MADAEKIHALYEIDFGPRWFPVFYMLTIKDSATVTELADDIGQTHPAVSQVVRAMTKDGIITSRKCQEDVRMTRVTLTPKGVVMTAKLAPQWEDVNNAVNDIFATTNSSLWSELEAIERELKDKSMLERVSEARKSREQKNTEIVEYLPKYKKAFKDLNVAWIEKYWEMEPSDFKALDNPTENIINTGGYIAVALRDNPPIGTCALIRMDDGNFELAKMAVSDGAKVLGVGTLLGQNMVVKARELGAKRIYMESNTLLEPAINLYRKLGFKRISGNDSPYKKCNIKMELVF